MSTQRMRGSTLLLVLPVLASMVHQANATRLTPERGAGTDFIPPGPVISDDVIETHSPQQANAAPIKSVASNMSENFESAWPASGWALFDDSSSDGGQYLWGKRNCHPHTGSSGGWSVGGGAKGATLMCAADYPNNSSTWATYGPFDLRGVLSASLTFHLWGRSEGGTGCPYDYLFAGSSTDGTAFSGSRYCGNWSSGSAGNGYHQVAINLASRVGQSQVWVAFRFRSDSTLTDTGFTIDDLVLSTSSIPPSTPTSTPTRIPTPTKTPPPGPSPKWTSYLPQIALNWNPSAPPPPENIPCLLVFARLHSASPSYLYTGCVTGRVSITYRYDPQTGAISGLDVTVENSNGITIYRSSIDIQRDQFGRVASYDGTVSGLDFPAFTQHIVNEYDEFGKIKLAYVTKVYIESGKGYTMNLTLCWQGDILTGYRVDVWGDALEGETFVIGKCS